MPSTITIYFLGSYFATVYGLLINNICELGYILMHKQCLVFFFFCHISVKWLCKIAIKYWHNCNGTSMLTT